MAGEHVIPRLVDKVIRLRAESKEALDYDDIVNDDLALEDLTRLWIGLGEWKTSLDIVEKAVGHQLVQLLDRSIEVDGFVVYAKTADKKEPCIDEPGFFGWLADHPDQTARLFNPNYCRRGALPPAVRDTFFEKVEVPRLDVRPAAVPVEVLETNRQRRAANG